MPSSDFTTSGSDPIQQAWIHARDSEARGCPDPARLAVAALNGPEGLPHAERAHLLESRCPQCEQELLRLWELRFPLADLMSGARQWPATGAMGTAFRHHLTLLGTPAAREAAAARDGAADSSAQTAPAASQPIHVRAGELLARVGASLAGALLFPPPSLQLGAVNDPRGRDRRAPRPTEAGSFGPAIKLSARGTDLVALEIDFDALPELHDRQTVVLILREQTAEPLAEASFTQEEASGVRTRELALNQGLVSSGELRIALGTFPPE